MKQLFDVVHERHILFEKLSGGRILFFGRLVLHDFCDDLAH